MAGDRKQPGVPGEDAAADRPPNATNRVLEFMAPGVVWDDNQRNIMAEGLITNVASTFVNPFLTPFALSFGASKFHISVLNALPGLLGNLMQVPASYAVERTGKRKSLIILSGLLTRAAWALVILLPFVTRGALGVYALIGLMMLISVFGSVVTPAWTSLASDLIPRQVRGRFFAARNIVMSIGALLTVNLAGQIVTRGGFPWGYATSALVFWVLSWAALYFVNRLDDVPFSPSRAERPGRMRLDTEALRDPRFSRWIWVTAFFSFFVGLAGSLFGAYLIQDLHGTPAHLAYMSFFGSITSILGQRFWGPVSDRKGPKFAVVVSACLSAMVPVLWYLAKNPWGGVLAETFSGAAWSGWTLCSFNLVLDITPETKRPSYVATANVVGGVAGFISPLIGGYFAMRHNLRPMMLLSAAGRLATGFLLQKFIADTQATSQAGETPGVSA